MDDNCPIHKIPWKIVPPGISKKTGKPYGQFLVCPVPDCKQKPAQVPLDVSEPLDNSLMDAQVNKMYDHEKVRQWEIKRQHAQEMAIRYLELKYQYEPPENGKLKLSDKVKLMTKWFMEDATWGEE